VTAGLVLRSFDAVRSVPHGFAPASFQWLPIALSPSVTEERALDAYRQIADAVSDAPGLESDVLADVPMVGTTMGPLLLDTMSGAGPRITSRRVGPRALDVMRLHLEEGRWLDAREALVAPAMVAVVDRRAADLLWPGLPALGRTLLDEQRRAYSVIGVVSTLSMFFYGDPAAPAGGTVFLPVSLAAASDLRLIVRWTTIAPPRPEAIDLIVAAAVPGASSPGPTAFSRYERAIGQPRFLAVVLGSLGVVTVFLAVFGLFGVVSHAVARRTREIGIRMALGATRPRVRAEVIGQALMPAAFGIVAGVVAAWWWTGSLKTVLTRIDPHDPVTFVAAAAGTVVVALAGCIIPARRASRVDPVVALRAE